MTRARWIRLTRGSPLMLQGSTAGRCWLLLAGYVKEHHPLDDGTEAVCLFRGPGDLVAEVAALTMAPSEHDVTAVSQGEALAFPADHLRAVVAVAPDLRAVLMLAIADRVATTEAALVRSHVTSTLERVSLAILELVDRWGVTTTDGVHVAIPLTQSELAEWVGTSRETAAKALGRLRRDGVVETARRHLVVHDMCQLRRAAGRQVEVPLAVPA